MPHDGWAHLAGCFADALLDPGGPPAAGLADLRSERRFRVHRNTVFAGLTGVLKARFPAVLRLMGEEFFLGAAQLHVQQSPPQGAALHVYGRDFADFLAVLPAVSEFPFLADVARLEWALHDALHAAEVTAIAADELARVAPEHAGDLRLALHPSLRLLSSPFPVFQIWRTNTCDPQVDAAAASGPGEQVAVWRDGLRAVACPVEAQHYAILLRLAGGQTLAAAAPEDAPDQLGPALGFLLVNGLVTSIIGVAPE